MGRCEEDMLLKLSRKEAEEIRHLQRKKLAENVMTNMEGTSTILLQQLSETCFFPEDNEYAKAEFLLRIARTMSESSLLTQEQDHRTTHKTFQVEKCTQLADFIWVPTQWHYEAFISHGIPQEKVAVIPETVDTSLFIPSDTKPRRKTFVFLSSFKWEYRKGWDILLQAYFSEFSARENVVLKLQSYVPSWISSISNITLHVEQVRMRFSRVEREKLPAYIWMDDDAEISRQEQVSLYQTSDAFVLPTRGEGWGLPLMEAMSVGLPVIATNFSGPTGFMDEKNSYLLKWNGYDPNGYAKPDVNHLRELMRHVFTHREEAYEIGKRAREHIVSSFSPRDIVSLMSSEINKRLKSKMNHLHHNEL